jgi:L-iditol 2-dehydrogenase
MKAAVLVAPRQLEVQEVPTPTPGRGEVLVDVRATSVCGSDLHSFQGEHARVRPPTWFGHEFAGVIAWVGQNVTTPRVGQRVAVDGVLPCAACHFCGRGQTNLCLNYRTTGYRRDGALAEYTCVPADNAYPIPDQLPFEEAALIQPLAITYHGVRRRANVQAGDQVLIIGAGPIGLCALLQCLACGARAMVSDLRDARLAMARQLGAEATIDLRHQDTLQVVREWTDGLGVDHVIEAVGGTQDETLVLGCQVLRKGGVVTGIGTFSIPTVSLAADEFRWKELSVLASHSYLAADYAACAELVSSGRVRLDALPSHHFPLAEAQQALTLLDSGAQDLVKVVIHPRG